MIKYTIIIPTHERPKELKSCLVKLQPILCANITCVLILDGSSKEVKSIVESFKSEFIHVIHGDGNLFWGGAISLGMKFSFEALCSDRVIWLNDDTNFDSGMISDFIEKKYDEKSIVGARLYASNVNRCIYSVDENAGLVEVKYLNGNFTSIPKYVFYKIGNIEPNKYPHFSDAPYIDLAKSNGIKLFCNTNVSVEIYYDVLRHLSIDEQVVLRRDKIRFIYWSFFDIRSKWYLSYRYYYTKNKFPKMVVPVFFAVFVKDWLKPLTLLPLYSLFDKHFSKMTLKKVKSNLSKEEYGSLIDEIEIE